MNQDTAAKKQGRPPPQRTKRHKRQKRLVDTSTRSPLDVAAIGPFFCILELGTASVWKFLAPTDVSSTLQAFPGVTLTDSVVLKAVEDFAVENKTHLGGDCQCDWMQNLNFSAKKTCCQKSPLFTVNKTMPIFRSPGGPQSLLEALVLAKKLLLVVSWANQFANPTYVPVVCPMSIKGGRDLRSKAAVSQAMNAVCRGAGSHYFYKVRKATRSAKSADYPDEHWDSINGSSCQYCDDLLEEVKYDGVRWKPIEVERIRANCEKLYQPLKTVMLQNLRFVRCVQRPRRQVSRGFAPYEGLVAGITNDGVLCGLYVRVGYWADY